MVGPRGPDFLLLCLPLISQVAAEAQAFVVSGAGYRDGVYEEQGEGADWRFQRMGGADFRGRHYYLYRGTEQADTWVLGLGRTFQARYAVYRAPAGEGGERMPQEENWQFVNDMSKDGRESGWAWDRPGMRVTSFTLKEATADQMFDRGGGQTAGGLVCKIRGLDSDWSSEEWKHMTWADEQMCDRTKNCENGLDEPVDCERFLVTGSDARDGVYAKNSLGTYKQQNGRNIIFMDADNRWTIAEGPSRDNATVHYKAESGRALVESSWENVFEEGSEEGKDCGKPAPDLLIIEAPTLPKNGTLQTEKGFACKSTEQNNKWLWMTNYKCSNNPTIQGLYDEDCACATNCVEGCYFYHIIKDIRGLVVRGPYNEQNGVYKLEYPNFFKQSEGEYLICRTEDGWGLGNGSSPQNVTNFQFKSENSPENSIPESGWKEGGRLWTDDIMKVNMVSAKAFSEEQMLEGEEDREEGVFCDGINGHRLFITKQGDDPIHCDGRYDCRFPNASMSNQTKPVDERFCSFFGNASIEGPILTTSGAVAGGILLFLVVRCCLEGKPKQTNSKRVSQDLRNAVDMIVEEANRRSNETDGFPQPQKMAEMKLRVPGSTYGQIHKIPGGLRFLIGVGFTFLAHPVARHLLAKYIVEQEKKIHGDENKADWRQCLRRKAGSNRASAAFLDSIECPGKRKWYVFRVTKAINWIVDPRMEDKTRWGRFKTNVKSWVVHGTLPLFWVFLYLMDYTKDTWLFVYLYQRLQFINDRCSLLRGLIYFYGASIGVAAFLMSFVIQINSGVLDLDAKFRILFIIFSPLVPVTIIVKAVTLTVSKSKLEAKWRRISKNAAAKWEKYRELDGENLEVMEAYSDLKMVECSTEAVPQFYFLVIFTIASVILPKTSGLGLLKDDSGYSWAFLVFSLTTTYATIIVSILSAMDIRKNGQLGLKQKAFLGLSATFQLMAHLCQMIPTAILALPLKDKPDGDGSYDASLTPTQAGFLLVTPIVLRWISFRWTFSLDAGFQGLLEKNQLIHVLANTWVTVPLRHKHAASQVRKSSEIQRSLVLAGFNIIHTWAMTATALSGKQSPALTSATKFYLVLLLPAITALICHLLGCLFLHLHYKATHPWRELFAWQRKEGIKDGIVEEVPCWEKVSWLYVQCKENAWIILCPRRRRRGWSRLLLLLRLRMKR